MSEIEQDYSKLKVTELKSLCKDRKLHVSGTKQELINRLLGIQSSNGSGSSSNVNGLTDDVKKIPLKKKIQLKTNLEKPVFKHIINSENIPILIKRNIHGNFEHSETHLVFSEQKKVIGIQEQTGEIKRLSIQDLEHVYKYHFELCESAKIQDSISDNILKDDSEKEKRIQDLISMTNGETKLEENDEDDLVIEE